jgi:DNA polymerase-1
VRKQVSPLYKSNRVKEAKPLFWQDATNLLKLFDLLGIEIYSAHSGYEGDDCIGSLVKTLQNEQVDDFKISIMSGDTDFAQLITQDGRVAVRRLLPKKIETMDYEGCLTLYGVPPSRVTDFKALAGDGADMILGVKGCGRKTAQRYISAHGSALQAATVECSLQPYKEQILRDLQLATIVCDLPMQKREAELRSLDAAKLFLEQLECPSLLKQISELYALSLFHS